MSLRAAAPARVPGARSASVVLLLLAAALAAAGCGLGSGPDGQSDGGLGEAREAVDDAMAEIVPDLLAALQVRMSVGKRGFTSCELDGGVHYDGTIVMADTAYADQPAAESENATLAAVLERAGFEAEPGAEGRGVLGQADGMTVSVPEADTKEAGGGPDGGIREVRIESDCFDPSAEEQEDVDAFGQRDYAALVPAARVFAFGDSAG